MPRVVRLLRFPAGGLSCLKCVFVCQFNLHCVASVRLILISKYFSRASQLMDDFEEMEAMVQDESDVKALK